MKELIKLLFLIGLSLVFFIEGYSQNTDNKKTDCIKDSVSNASVIIVAEVRYANLAHGFFSGNGGISLRAVKYRVKQIIKGELKENIVWASYSLFEGLHYLDGNALSPVIFSKGNKHILMIQESKSFYSLVEKDRKKVGKSKLYAPYDSECTPLTANDENVKLIKNLIELSTHAKLD